MSENKPHIDPNLWIANYGDLLFNYASSRVRTAEIAEDIVQETFISALRTMKNFRGESTEKTWLFAILKRKIIDHYRKSSTTKEINESRFDSPFQQSGFFEGHWNTDKAPSEWSFTAEGNLHQAEFQEIMEYCLSFLPDKWKAIFVMKVMEELDSAEICKEMECSSSNLWVILHRARLKLRECIETNWMND